MKEQSARPGRFSSVRSRPVPVLVTILELLAIYAAILLYIWRWQYTHVDVWMVLLGVVILSHIIHGDTLNEMGLTGREFGPSARLILPLLISVAVPAVLYELWKRGWTASLPNAHAWLPFGAYAVWCSFQQYLMQSYFHRRLRSVIETPHLSSFAVALMFGGAHIPNPILMAATFAGGFVLAEVFVRHPNIWPLAFVQAAAGFLIGGLSPDSLIHHMRVGPGYYYYHLR